MTFDHTLLCGLFLSLCFWIPTRIDGDELFSFYALMLVAVGSFFYRPKRSVKIPMLAAIFAFAMVSAFLNFTWPVRAVLINFFVALVALKVIADRTELTPKKIGSLLLAVCLVNYVFIGLQIIGKDQIFGAGEVAGVFIIPWAMGSFAVLAMPFLFSINPVLSLIYLTPLLIMSKSWTCLLLGAACFGALSFQKIKPRIAIIITISLVLLAAVYIHFFGHHLDRGRFTVWTDALAWMKNSYYGSGLGSWAHEGFIRKNGEDYYHWRTAHCEPYQFYFELGIIGLSALGFWFVNLIRKQSYFYKVVLMNCLLLSMVHAIFHQGRLAFFLVIIFAIASKEAMSWQTAK